VKKWPGFLMVIPLSLALVGCGNATIPPTASNTIDSLTEVADTITAKEPPSSTRQSNFSLIFRYGPGWENDGSAISGTYNEMNTLTGTYTKDMISAGTVKVNIFLSSGELNHIFSKMLEIEFYNYPSTFSINLPQGTTTTIVTPSEKYYFSVTNGSETQELYWDDKIRNEDIQANKLRSLILLIKNIIAAKDAYRALPPASGGYV
jgi:hypothetical protein